MEFILQSGTKLDVFQISILLNYTIHVSFLKFRPKKCNIDKVPPPPTQNGEEDPCIVTDLATKLFPELSLHQAQKSNKDKTVIPNYAIIRIPKGKHTLEFPAMQAQDNYPAILNELVTHM